jgi:hypothetical protein
MRGRSIAARAPRGALWLLVLVACGGKKSDRAEVSFKDKFHVEDIDLDKYSSFYAYKTRSGDFQFSLGLTSPVHLVSYRDAQQYPAYCHRTQIFPKLEELARSHGCDVDDTSIDGTPTQLIKCTIPAPQGSDACPSSYVAQVWQERWPNSNEDYELDMYARVRAVCEQEKDFQTFHASDDVTAAAEKRSGEVVSLLAACQTDSPAGGTP